MNEAKLLRESYYDADTMIEVPGQLLTTTITIVKSLVDAEIKGESKYKYKYVNDKGKEVKKVSKSDIESGKVAKVVDWERTITSPTIEYSITEKGLEYADFLLYLQSLHLKNIREGKTKNINDEIKISNNKS